MTRYALSFLLESLVMSSIILTFFVFSTLFLKRVRARLRYAVWVVFLVGLLIPMSFLTNAGFVSIELPAEGSLRSVQTGEPLHLPHWENSVELESPEKEAENAFSSAFIASPFVLGIWIWCAGAAVIWIYHILRYFRFVALMQRWAARVDEESILSVFRSVQKELGLSEDKIELRSCELVSSSLLIGFLRPVIILPKDHFETDELEVLFRHELIHYKRRDLYIKLLSVAAISVHWLNPVVYFMNAAIQADGEASCDEAVLRDANEEDRHFYAELMIKMIGSRNTTKTMLSTCFYASKKSVKKRLNAILTHTESMRKPAYATFAAFAVMTLLSGSVFALQPDEPAPDRTNGSVSSRENISLTQAKDAAVKAAGGGTVGRYEIRYDKHGAIYHYKIILANGDAMYDIDVDGLDGEVKKIETKPITTVDANVYETEGLMEAAKAREIAVESAGGGVVVECRLEKMSREQILVYHIHVVIEQWEYCVEVDANTGAIHKFEPRFLP